MWLGAVRIEQIAFDQSPKVGLPCSLHARRAERVCEVPASMAACRRLCTLGAACHIVSRAIRYDNWDRLCRASVVTVANAASRVEAHDVGEGVVRRNGFSEVDIKILHQEHNDQNVKSHTSTSTLDTPINNQMHLAKPRDRSNALTCCSVKNSTSPPRTRTYRT